MVVVVVFVGLFVALSWHFTSDCYCVCVCVMCVCVMFEDKEFC